MIASSSPYVEEPRQAAEDVPRRRVLRVLDAAFGTYPDDASYHHGKLLAAGQEESMGVLSV